MENKYNIKLLSMAGLGGSAFGIALIELDKEHNNIKVLSSDMSTPAGLDKFKSSCVDKFINVGIAEQNLIGMAAGLSSEGYKVICVAQASFLTMRGFEQIRQYCGYMGKPLILIGVGSGLSLQYMGNTHYSMEDLALLRTIPKMNVIAPADSLEAIKALQAAYYSTSPCYIRLFGGTNTPVVYNQDYDFKIGKAVSLKEGTDIQIIATGSMVSVALAAAELLTAEGVSASVVDMHTIKPLDTAIISMDKKLIVTLEEHGIIGGLGSAVAEFLSCSAKHPKLLRLGIEDRYLSVGSYQYLLKEASLSAVQIKENILKEII